MRVRLSVLGWELIDLMTGRDAADEDEPPRTSSYGSSFLADTGGSPIRFGYWPLSPDDEPVQEPYDRT